MQKGISPLIAAVLLIAATMSIAGILAYWASNFVKSALPENTTSQTTCQFADFQLYQCNYASSTQTISFVLYNYRTISLSGLTATIFDTNNFPIWNNITLNASVPVGQFVGYSIPSIPSNFTKLVVTSVECPSISHDSTCTRT